MKARHLHLEDLPPGTPAPTWQWGPVTLTDIVRYAGASGDFTPIHHDPEAARGLGLDRVFAMGMMTGGFLGHFIADWLDGRRVRDFSVRFIDKTWVGDTLHFHGRVVASSSAASSAVVAVEASAVAHDGRLLASAAVSATVQSRPDCAWCSEGRS